MKLLRSEVGYGLRASQSTGVKRHQYTSQRRSDNQFNIIIYFAIQKVHRMLIQCEELRERNEIDDAEKGARDAVKLGPNISYAHAYLGTFLLFKNDLIEAENELRKAIELNGNNYEFHYRLSQVLHEKGNIAEAKAETEISKQLQKSFPR
jgi:tetratricopeptide (TPR) repeat protein